MLRYSKYSCRKLFLICCGKIHWWKDHQNFCSMHRCIFCNYRHEVFTRIKKHFPIIQFSRLWKVTMAIHRQSWIIPDQWFACARLLESYLTPSCEAFSLTLTTLAFYQRSLRWFKASTCMAASRNLPSSLAQHRTLGYKTLWCVRGTLVARHLQFRVTLPNHHILAYPQLILAKSPQNQ